MDTKFNANALHANTSYTFYVVAVSTSHEAGWTVVQGHAEDQARDPGQTDRSEGVRDHPNQLPRHVQPRCRGPSTTAGTSTATPTARVTSRTGTSPRRSPHTTYTITVTGDTTNQNPARPVRP